MRIHLSNAIDEHGGEDDVPFGAMIFGDVGAQQGASKGPRPEPGGGARPQEGEHGKDWRRPENRRGGGRRGGRRRRRNRDGGPFDARDDARQPLGGEGGAPNDARESGRGDMPRDAEAPQANYERAPNDVAPRDIDAQTDRRSNEQGDRRSNDFSEGRSNEQGGGPSNDQGFGEQRGRRRRRRRGRGGRGGQPFQHGGAARDFAPQARVETDDQSRAPVAQSDRPERSDRNGEPPALASGMIVLEKGNIGFLRRLENDFLRGQDDVFVSPALVQRHRLREGSLIEGPIGRGGGPSRHQLLDVTSVDGKPPRELMNLVPFKRLTSIDPDFHYAVGDLTGDVNLKILDLLCPIGRGTRGLLVAPPRSGKTILMRKFAKAIEDHYSEVELIVLLIDERPEEATEWQRSLQRGHVFVSTNDEMAERHCELAEAVQLRAMRLVELGKDVVLLLDSITRLARAYNSAQAGSGRTMSGGLDTRTMEKPKAFFGSARNTESAGSLTILGTTLVDTGSRMDQVIFEEFKGTGNMELVLSRKLADRRIFPAIDIEKSGTRKEEKLISARRLKQIHILRRVLAKMNFVEAMELLITKLEDVEKTDDFLKRFEVDPEA